MRTIKRAIYRFAELDKDGQARAIQDYVERFDFDPDYIYDDFLSICGLLGVEVTEHSEVTEGGQLRKRPAIYWSGFGNQGDGACFEGTYTFKAGAIEALKAYAPTDERLHEIASTLQSVQERNGFALAADITHRDRYVHAYSVDIDVRDVEDEDRTVDKEDEEVVTETLRDLMKWLYRQLEEDYFYQTSDETVADFLESCDFYEFYEDGSLYT